MSEISRRSLARYGAEQIIAGKPAADVAKHLAGMMIESGLTDEVEFLLSDIAWELEQQKELAIGLVTTATPLTKELENALKAQLIKATEASEVLLEKNTDKSVIGGIKVETSGRVWDETVARKLTDLREAF